MPALRFPFRWSSLRSGLVLQEDLVIYEMHVRGFSHKSPSAKAPGQLTLLNIQHLKTMKTDFVPAMSAIWETSITTRQLSIICLT